MTNKNLTDITLVVDRSGSMFSCQSDAQGGINTFIKEQDDGIGKTDISLYEFDNKIDKVFGPVVIGDAPKYRLVPRGGTSLLDAVGLVINETGARLRKLPEHHRPGLVIIAIVTDGGENSSREFTNEQIKQMVDKQETDYKWQFTYLGANQDAFAVGGAMGFAPQVCASYNVDKSAQTYNNLNSSVSRMKCASVRGMAVDNAYTDEERDSMK